MQNNSLNNNNGNSPEVNSENRILPFPASLPAEEITFLREQLTAQGRMLASLLEMLAAREARENRAEATEAKSAPTVPSGPEEKDARETLLQEVARVISSLDTEIRFGAVPGSIFKGTDKDIYRLYLLPDRSYLYVDRHGNLWPGHKDKKVKGLLAARLLDRLRELAPYFAELEPPIECPLLLASLKHYDKK